MLYINYCPKSVSLLGLLQVLAEQERLPGAMVAEAWGSAALRGILAPHRTPGTRADVVNMPTLGRSALYTLYVNRNQDRGPLNCTESLLTTSCCCTEK